MERTRALALRELRNLLSEVLSTAASDESVPAAFKNPRNWEFLITRTESRMQEAWKKRFATRKDELAGGLGNLELLSDEETDQALAGERFVSEVLQEQADSLEDLEKQLAAMSGIPATEKQQTNPLGPEAWAAGLRSGVRDVECSPDDRDWLMEQIMPLLTDRVAQFYEALSQGMASAGYAAPHRPGRVRQQATKAKPKPAAADGGFAPEQVEKRTEPAAPMMGEGGEFDGPERLEQLLGLISAQRAGAGGGIAGGYFGPAPEGPPTPSWNNDQMMSVLGALQAKSTEITSAEGTAQGLRDAIGSAAKQLGFAGGVHSMPAQAQDTLALVSMLFEVLLDDKNLDPLALSQLSRLIVPYVRMAVLDRQLFMQSAHPARRVLNSLVEALETAGPDSPKHKALRDLALGTIEQIVVGFNDDISIFGPMEAALDAEIEASRKRAELAEKRAAEAHAARERREEARDQVAEFLAEVLFGKRIPQVLLEFLLGPWQSFQNGVLLREGEGAEEVLANQFLLRDLLRANDSGTIANPEKMRAALAAVFEGSGQSAEAAKDFIAQLEATFKVTAAVEKAKAAVPPGTEVKLPPLPAAAAPVVVERAVLESTAAAIVPAAPVTDAFVAPATVEAPPPEDLVASYEAMPLGTWVDMVAADGKVSTAKLSFISPISGKRILSNRRGQRILCASVPELAAMESAGQIKRRHSARAFDNALGAVGKRLESTVKPEPLPA